MILAVMKTTGIVLLVLFVIFLIIAALVLFLPIQYRIRGNLKEKQFHINVNWMFRMVRLIGEIGEEKLFQLRLLFFRIKLYPRDKEKDAIKKQKKQERKRKKQKKREQKVKRKREKARKKAERERSGKAKSEHSVTIKKENTESANTSEETKTLKPEETKASKQATTSESEEKKKFELPKFDKLKNVYAKLQKGFEMVKKAWSVLQKGNVSQVAELIIHQIKYLLYHYRPRKVQGDLVFGMKDPSVTGKVLGGISMASFLFEYDLKITPVFETEELVLEGEFDVRGHIRVIHLLIVAIRLIRNKDFRTFVKLIIKQVKGQAE